MLLTLLFQPKSKLHHIFAEEKNKDLPDSAQVLPISPTYKQSPARATRKDKIENNKRAFEMKRHQSRPVCMIGEARC